MNNDFSKNGFVVIRNLLSHEDVKRYKLNINKVFNLPEREMLQTEVDNRTFTCPDGVTKFKTFWEIIFNKKLLNEVKKLLGKEIRYTQHSDLHINLGAGNFHRDNAFREFGNGPDWQIKDFDYKIVRVAIYLSDSNESGSSLIILPGTHKKESKINKLELNIWRRIRNNLRRKNLASNFPHIFFSGKKTVIKTKPGDCIIFDQRLIHAGGVIKGISPKYAIFLSYGAPNIHSINHHNFYLSRPTYLKKISSILKKKLKAKNLLLV